MKTTEDILAGIKKEVKLSKKLAKETPTGRQITLKNIEAEEKARKLRKDKYDKKFMAVIAVIVFVFGGLVRFIPAGYTLSFMGLSIFAIMYFYKGDEQ